MLLLLLLLLLCTALQLIRGKEMKRQAKVKLLLLLIERSYFISFLSKSGLLSCVTISARANLVD